MALLPNILNLETVFLHVRVTIRICNCLIFRMIRHLNIQTGVPLKPGQWGLFYRSIFLERLVVQGNETTQATRSLQTALASLLVLTRMTERMPVSSWVMVPVRARMRVRKKTKVTRRSLRICNRCVALKLNRWYWSDGNSLEANISRTRRPLSMSVDTISNSSNNSPPTLGKMFFVQGYGMSINGIVRRM